MKKRITHRFTQRTALNFRIAIVNAAALILQYDPEQPVMLKGALLLVKLALRIKEATQLPGDGAVSIDRQTGDVIDTMCKMGAFNGIDVHPTALAIIAAFKGKKTKPVTRKQRARRAFSYY